MQRNWVRHRAFYIAAAAGLLGLGLTGVVLPDFAVETGACLLFGVYLGLILIHLPKMTADYLKKRADEEDPPVSAILLVTALVIAVAAVELFLALNGSGPQRIPHVVMGMVSVALGWSAVHAMAAMHYAYEYYEAPEKGEGDPDARGGQGGLDFPGEEQPDGVAFLYFSYTIGTTAQVSDVSANSNAMRKRILIHMLFSYVFNTVIIAAAVNAVIAGAG
jgi:uncharacterized membrane protein